MSVAHALQVARRVAEELAENGAQAVALVGSYARNETGPESDIDLLVVGSESYLPRLERRDDMLVSVSMQPFDLHGGSFEQPELVCTAIPGCREALVLHDPEGLAASLVGQAREWTWKSLERRCDGWVAEEGTGYAEEVHKLATALKRNNLPTAAAQRPPLAVRMALVLAVHHRILYGSENGLWDVVSEAMGDEWCREQSCALGLNNESFEKSCAAALRPYALSAAEVASLLNERQRAIVEHARALAG